MKKLCLAIGLIFALLSCVGCGQRLDPAVLPEEESAEEITVAICQSEPFEIEAYAGLFENETGIKVNVINYFEPAPVWEVGRIAAKEYSYDMEGNVAYVNFGEYLGDCGTTNYITTANTDLMAGKGADIYDVGLLDYGGLGKNGLLCDMSGWIDEDLELSDEILLHSILKAAEEEDGSLYAMMPEFRFEAVAQENWDLESPLENKPITWEGFFEREKDKPRQGVIYDTTDQVVFMKRFQDRREKFINGNDVSSLDSSAMVELLEQCRAWAEKGYIIDSRNPDKYVKFAPMYWHEDIRWATTQALFGIPNSCGMEPSDDPAHQWENRMVTDQGLYGINAASESRGTAWAFLKMMLSEKVQREFIGSWPPNNFPIHREGLEEQLQNELAFMIESKGKTEKELAEQVDAVIKKFDGMDQINLMQPYDKIIRAAAGQYFTGQITAQQAAKQMADKVALYLKETA